jgi:hypothetical protein
MFDEARYRYELAGDLYQTALMQNHLANIQYSTSRLFLFLFVPRLACYLQ